MVLQSSKKFRDEYRATQLLEKIANKVNIGAVTIRDTYTAVFRQRDILLPEDYLKNGDTS